MANPNFQINKNLGADKWTCNTCLQSDSDSKTPVELRLSVGYELYRLMVWLILHREKRSQVKIKIRYIVVTYLHSLCSHRCWRLVGSLNKEKKIGESCHFAIPLLLQVIKPSVLQTREGAHMFCSKLRVSLNWIINSWFETHATKPLQRSYNSSTVTCSFFSFFNLGKRW